MAVMKRLKMLKVTSRKQKSCSGMLRWHSKERTVKRLRGSRPQFSVIEPVRGERTRALSAARACSRRRARVKQAWRPLDLRLSPKAFRTRILRGKVSGAESLDGGTPLLAGKIWPRVRSIDPLVQETTINLMSCLGLHRDNTNVILIDPMFTVIGSHWMCYELLCATKGKSLPCE